GGWGGAGGRGSCPGGGKAKEENEPARHRPRRGLVQPVIRLRRKLVLGCAARNLNQVFPSNPGVRLRSARFVVPVLGRASPPAPALPARSHPSSGHLTPASPRLSPWLQILSIPTGAPRQAPPTRPPAARGAQRRTGAPRRCPMIPRRRGPEPGEGRRPASLRGEVPNRG